MNARYLGSAVVVTLLSSVSIRVSNSFILKQRSSYVIAQLSSPIKFSLRNLSMYMWLLALNVALWRPLSMLLLDIRPKLSSLKCLHISWLFRSYVGGPCSKILVELHCSFSYWWASATLIVICPALESFPHRSCHCFINWILSQCNGFVPWISFVLSPTPSSLWMFISLDLMLLLDKTKSHVNLYLVITLVDTRRLWKLSKSLLLSCLRQLGYVLLCCVLIFWSPPCWFLTLWLSWFAPSLAQCLFLQSNWCH